MKSVVCPRLTVYSATASQLLTNTARSSELMILSAGLLMSQSGLYLVFPGIVCRAEAPMAQAKKAKSDELEGSRD